MDTDYLSMFIDETREHLQAWSDGMIKLEKTGDESVVPVIFRAAHTIKGMAMTMGFKNMGDITHHAESLLDGLRNHKYPVTTERVNVLLQALDALEGLLAGVEQDGVEPTANVSDLLAQLDGGPLPQSQAPVTVNEKTDGEQVSQVVRDVANQAVAEGRRVFEFKLSFATECIMPMARFAQVLQRIDTDALLYTHPEAAVLDAGDYNGDITFLLAAQEDVEALGARIADVSEVLVTSIREWTQDQDWLGAGTDILSTDPLDVGDHVSAVIAEILKQGHSVYEIGVRLMPGTALKSPRLYMVFEAVGGQDRLLYTKPQMIEIEQDRFDRDVQFMMWSNDQAEVIRRAIANVSEIELVQLRQWSDAGGHLLRGENVAATASQQSQVVGAPRKKTSTIRVDTDKLDDLMNLVSELVIDKTRLELIRQEVAHAGLGDTITHMSRISNELQTLIMAIRLIPVASVFSRFPRMVRDTAQQLGKELEFIMTGEETELDRTVVEEIGDPIMHLLRNALDHGVESRAKRQASGKPPVAKVQLRAYAAGNHVFIEVEDDGAGIDRDHVLHTAINKGIVSADDHLTDSQVYNLLFASGFSTADVVTDLSGRGVGLDVVKSKIESLSGKVDIHSEPGVGTKFMLQLPMTLAILQGLMVRVGDDPYLLPLASVSEVSMEKETQFLDDKEIIVWRDQVLPIVRTRTVFQAAASETKGWLIILQRGDRRIGLIVDQVMGQSEVVLKSLDKRLRTIGFFSGATILGDGNVALIIDGNAFFD